MKGIFKLGLIILTAFSFNTLANENIKDAMSCHDFKVVPLSQAKVTTYKFKKEVFLDMEYDGVYLFDDKVSLEQRRLDTIKALENYYLKELMDKEAYNHIKKYTKTDESFKNLYKEVLVSYWVADAINGKPHKLKNCNYLEGVNMFIYSYYTRSTVNSLPVFQAIVKNSDVIYFSEI